MLFSSDAYGPGYANIFLKAVGDMNMECVVGGIANQVNDSGDLEDRKVRMTYGRF